MVLYNLKKINIFFLYRDIENITLYKMNILKNKIPLKIKIPYKNKTQQIISNQEVKNESNRNTISQITENIYISGYLIGKNITYLQNNNFTHVINCSMGSSMESSQDKLSTKESFLNNGIKYLPLSLRDDPEIELIYYFFEIINFIESDKEIINQKILFHCIEGISRAPTMVAAYLMWKKNLSISHAIKLIKLKRQCVDINLGFNIQLQKWGNYIFSSPKKLQVFKLYPNIRLLEEEEKELNMKESYLIKMHCKLFYINNIPKEENDNNYSFDYKCDNNIALFQACKDKNKEFIKYIIKYDKKLLKNDFSSLVEIRKNFYI